MNYVTCLPCLISVCACPDFSYGVKSLVLKILNQYIAMVC